MTSPRDRVADEAAMTSEPANSVGVLLALQFMPSTKVVYAPSRLPRWLEQEDGPRRSDWRSVHRLRIARKAVTPPGVYICRPGIGHLGFCEKLQESYLRHPFEQVRLVSTYVVRADAWPSPAPSSGPLPQAASQFLTTTPCWVKRPCTACRYHRCRRRFIAAS